MTIIDGFMFGVGLMLSFAAGIAALLVVSIIISACDCAKNAWKERKNA